MPDEASVTRREGWAGSLGPTLVRVNPFDAHELAKLQLEPLLYDHLAKYESILEAALGAIPALSARLSELVSEATDARVRSRYLEARRRVTQGKPSSLDREEVPEQVRQLLLEFDTRVAILGKTKAELDSRFSNELSREESQLRTFCSIDDISRTLPLLSTSFSSALLAGDDSRRRPTSRRKSQRIRLSELRYVSRALTKTSPFSRITGVAAHEELARDVDHHSPRYRVRINLLFWNFLLETFLLYPPLHRWLRVSLNPQVWREGEQVAWLNSFRNQAAISRTLFTPQLETVLTLTSSRTTTSLSSLCRLLRKAGLSNARSSDELAIHLIQIGLLIAGLPIRPTRESWAGALAGAMRHARKTAITRALANLLAHLERLRNALGHLGGVERLASLSACRTALELLGDAELRASKRIRHRELRYGRMAPPSLERFVFEDRIEGRASNLDQDARLAIAAALDPLCRALAPFSPEVRVRAQLAEYLETSYPRGASIPLLQLFEEFGRATEARGAVPSQSDQAIDRERQQVRDVLAVLPAASPDNNDLHLSSRGLVQALANIRRARAWFSQDSLSAFVQRAGFRRIVLNDLWPGFGRAHSRFLDQLPLSVSRRLQLLNGRHPRGEVVEILDMSPHNANIHPPLTTRYLGQDLDVGRPRSSRILARDCFVRWLPPFGLELHHKDEPRPLLPIDLGFVTPVGRSPLFNFLRILGPQCVVNSIYLSHVLESLNHRLVRAGDSQFYRRVILDDFLVVSRRKWILPPPREACSQRTASFTDQYLETRRWLSSFDVPDQFYLQLERQAGGDARASDVERNPTIPRPARKPQFIDSRSVVFQELLNLEISRDRREVIIEEALPGPAEYAVIEGKASCTEEVVTWYAYPE